MIKTLADNSDECDSRIVKELYLWPLTEEAAGEFLGAAESRLGFTFKPTVKDAIVAATGGYPYFVHLVGLESLDAMQNRDPDARVVDEHDYKMGVRRAVQAAFRSELRKYRTAVKSLTDDDVTVMRELSLLTRSKTVTETDLERRILHATAIDREQFADILRKLRSKRLMFTTTTTKHVRFVDPLMASFLRAAIFPALSPDPDLRQLSLFADA